MVICESQRLLYLAPPKTGTSTITSILENSPYNGTRDKSHPTHATIWDDRFQDWCICISTRHPYTGVVSHWKFARQQMIKHLSQPRVRFKPYVQWLTAGFDNTPPTFFEFLTKFPNLILLHTVTRPSWHLEQIPRPVDHVIHQERLSDDLAKIPAFSGISKAIPRRNMSADRTAWHAYYTPDLIARVHEYWGQDFAAFGYNPDFEACVRGEFFVDGHLP